MGESDPQAWEAFSKAARDLRAADRCRQQLADSGKSKWMVGPLDPTELVRQTAQLLMSLLGVLR